MNKKSDILREYPCQQLFGGTGAAIYSNVDGMCNHEECNPENNDNLLDLAPKKPNELTGNVEKFIDIMFSFMETRILVRDFYNQPLPETAEEIEKMIEEYFDGFEKDGVSLAYKCYYNSEVLSSLIFNVSDTQDILIHITPIPKTLSDFISACKNSEITLKWK